MSEFGVTVKAVRHKYGPEWDEDKDAYLGRRIVKHDLDPPGWHVYLPHQCNSWDIAGDGLDDGVPKAEAVAALEGFIAEAGQALEALRSDQEYGDD